jgi:uncharacterized membrane protein YccC
MIENNLKRARWTAVIFGTLLSITLIALVYAFVQQAEAKRQAALAIECERRSIELVMQLEAKNQEAVEEVLRAEGALKKAEEMRLKAESNKK